ncbi:FAD binding domain-containing protein [Poronia punctata]|nr:FAD binding domain-containing protein [Poronia punctata]
MGHLLTLLFCSTPGYGIQLHSNGVRVLQDIGVYERLLPRATKCRSIVLRAYDTDRVMHKQDLSELESKYGAPVLTVHRAHLRECLYEAAVTAGAQIQMGTDIAASSIDMVNGLVTPCETGEDGGSSYDIEADLFIGADGIGSAVRAAMIGRETDINPHGQVVNRMAVDKSAVQAIPSLRQFVDESGICLWMGPSGHVVLYTLHGTMYIAYVQPWSSSLQDAFFGPQKVGLADLALALQGWDPRLHTLIGLSPDGNCERRMLFEPPSHEISWVNDENKFCIVGDAAHPILPYLSQGAAQGLESISVLSYLLGKAKSSDDFPKCLSLYQHIRKERVGHVSRASRKSGRLWQSADGAVRQERDQELLSSEAPTVGHPNLLADPFFQCWLWEFDARNAVDKVWQADK